ncbi:glycosyltransferase family 2 protein [Bacillus timonensis]|uniref:glycosyltransferase family 2 protein n=1 Tax=Bacillus timonensis TaxID=1033734 RepID=UPI0005A96E6F|nr:glycosyltransferase family 2 protein [Bacillus timonensis]
MVTVLIPFYNRKKFIRDAVESVLWQTYRNWKLILIDDGSTDNGSKEVEEYLSDSRISLIKNEENIGKVRSLNKALLLVDTPFILELDSDDLLFKYTIKDLVNEAMNQPEDVAIISGNMVRVIIGPDKEIVSKNRVKGRQFNDKYEYLLSNRVVWPRFYRTSALKEIGGWQTDDPLNGLHGLDDLRILIKFVEKYKFKWINREFIMLRIHDENISENKDVINKMREWVVRDTLKRWGDLYEPIFIEEDGWKYVNRLVPK